jgi:hypothetical protein
MEKRDYMKIKKHELLLQMVIAIEKQENIVMIGNKGIIDCSDLREIELNEIEIELENILEDNELYDYIETDYEKLENYREMMSEIKFQRIKTWNDELIMKLKLEELFVDTIIAIESNLNIVVIGTKGILDCTYMRNMELSKILEELFKILKDNQISFCINAEKLNNFIKLCRITQFERIET